MMGIKSSSLKKQKSTSKDYDLGFSLPKSVDFGTKNAFFDQKMTSAMCL